MKDANPRATEAQSGDGAGEEENFYRVKTEAESQSGVPPRVLVCFHEVSDEYLIHGEPKVQAQAFTKEEVAYRTPDRPVKEYLSLSEAQEMAERAREEAFREMQTCAATIKDLAERVIVLGRGDALVSVIPARLAIKYAEELFTRYSSKPTPQGGGEKKEGT